MTQHATPDDLRGQWIEMMKLACDLAPPEADDIVCSVRAQLDEEADVRAEWEEAIANGYVTVFAVGDRVRALYPNERLGTGTIVEAGRGPGQKPYTVLHDERDGARVYGYYHVDQIERTERSMTWQ